MADFEVDPLDLDTDTPVCDAFFIDRDSDMFHQHGGVTTRVLFQNVEEMDISELKKELEKPIEQDQLMTVRSVQGKYMMMLRGDRVIRYNGCTFQDCVTGQMMKLMQDNAGMVYTPMSQYPLLHVQIKDQAKVVTVRVPKHKILFQGDKSIGSIEDEVMLPDLWFSCRMSLANTVQSAYVAVEDTLDPDPKRCKLRQLCFPNTYTSGSICFGGTRTDTTFDTMTESMVVSATISRLFNSLWNNHVLWDHKAFLESCKPIYEGLPVLPIYNKAIKKIGSNNCTDANFLRYLRILHEPDGYMRVTQPAVMDTNVINNFLPGAV